MTLSSAFAPSKLFVLKSGGHIYGRLIGMETATDGVWLNIDGSRGDLPDTRWRILASRVIKIENRKPVSFDDLADFDPVMQ